MAAAAAAMANALAGSKGQGAWAEALQWMAQAAQSQTPLHREMALVLLSALMEKTGTNPALIMLSDRSQKGCRQDSRGCLQWMAQAAQTQTPLHREMALVLLCALCHLLLSSNAAQRLKLKHQALAAVDGTGCLLTEAPAQRDGPGPSLRPGGGDRYAFPLLMSKLGPEAGGHCLPSFHSTPKVQSADMYACMNLHDAPRSICSEYGLEGPAP